MQKPTYCDNKFSPHIAILCTSASRNTSSSKCRSKHFLATIVLLTVHEFFGQATQPEANPEANILQAQLQYFFSQCNSIFSQATTLQEDNELGKILKKMYRKTFEEVDAEALQGRSSLHEFMDTQKKKKEKAVFSIERSLHILDYLRCAVFSRLGKAMESYSSADQNCRSSISATLHQL